MHRFFGIIALFLILNSTTHVSILNYLKNKGEISQKNCITFVENRTAHFLNDKMSTTDEILALICGKNISTPQHQSLYALSGLIHLFVVSGSHFLLLENLASLCRVPLILRFFLHILFLFCSGFQPPAFRFLIHFILLATLFRNITTLRHDQKIFLSGFFTLCLFPSWLTSFSFLLSWAASLAITCCHEIHGFFRRHILTQIAIFLILFPLLCHLQTPHPLSIPLNLLLGSFLGMLLLPLAALAIFFHIAFQLMETLLSTLHQFLELIFHSPWSRFFLFAPPLTIPQSFMIVWIFFIHLCSHLWFVHNRRAQISLNFSQQKTPP